MLVGRRRYVRCRRVCGDLHELGAVIHSRQDFSRAAARPGFEQSRHEFVLQLAVTRNYGEHGFSLALSIGRF